MNYPSFCSLPRFASRPVATLYRWRNVNFPRSLTHVSLYRTILEKRIGEYSSISYALWQVILVEGRNTLLYKLSYTLSYVRNDCLHAKFDSVAHLFHLTICRQESFAARKLVLKFSFNIDRKTAKQQNSKILTLALWFFFLRDLWVLRLIFRFYEM